MSNYYHFSNLDSTTSQTNALEAKPMESEKIIIGKMLDLNDLTCSICFEIFEKPSELKCNHVFCFKCIHNWMRNNKSCPICRRNTIDQPARCMKLEKLILEMKLVSVPVANRRYTIGTILKTQEPLTTTRPIGRRELHSRPPWR